MRPILRCRSIFSLRPDVLFGVVAALLPLSCARPVPPPAAEARAETPVPERVSLGFGLPAGFTARVTGEETSLFVSDADREESRMQMSYRVRLEPNAGGARVQYDDFALPDPRTDALVRLAEIPGLEGLGAALRPSFVVSTDGRFEGAPDLDGVVAAINHELDALNARPSGPPGGAPLLPARFSAALFRRHADSDWRPMVELWAGREIELGARYAVEMETRLPLLAGVSIRMAGELHVSGRIACDDADRAMRCVELRMASRPDPDALAPLLEDRDATPPAPVVLSALELDETVRVVTEPETLVPHRVSTARRARLALRLPDGSLRSSSLDEKKDLVFHPESS